MLAEKDIKLFPHNEKAYQALINGLENSPLAFIEHATGTGKSMILLKYLYTKMRRKRVLFVSLHDEMFTQLFGNQMSSLGMKKSDFYKFDTLLYHNIMKYDMNEIIKNYDCIIFDEAHHCGANKWSQKVLELKNLVLNTPGKVMIGTTATGTRYLDDYTDVSEVYFNGNTVSNLPISTAILNNLLPAPLYINSLSSCLEYLEKVEKKIAKLPNSPEIVDYKNKLLRTRDRIEKENSIPDILKKYDIKPGEKYIVFCKDIDDLKEKKKEAEKWFKLIGPIKTFAAHSGQKKSKNFTEIEEFSKSRSEISLMFAVDIFNEGFHIDGVDGILMFRKTKSPIIYLQQLGRALSFSVRKKQIKIFDFVNNIAQNDVVYSLYKEMITEARKLILEDPQNKELYEEILKRFKIIDETTSVIDELKEIETCLDENYILKGQLDSAIHKLEEYRNFYPNTDFKEELANNRLNPIYVNAYKYICRMDEYLTMEQIESLHKLNIDFNKMINLSREKRESLLKDSKTIRELKEKQRKEFIKKYISFYQKYNRRPSLSNDEYEMKLYKQYRDYLEILSLSKLRKMVNEFPFVESVEETILIGNYPEKDKVEEYIAEITKKIESRGFLDATEKKVVKKIFRMLNLDNPILSNYMSSVDDITLKIEKAIEIISRYKREVNPHERFENLSYILGEKEVYSAITLINKYAKRVINSQFEKLLSLDIKLPSKIDMSMEKRLELLRGFNSFYELEKNFNILNEYKAFVEQNKRRPSNSTKEERDLVCRYENFLKTAAKNRIKEVCNILKDNDIELNFFEKIITLEYVAHDDLVKFLNYIKDKLRNNIEVKPEELRLLRVIEKGNYAIDFEVISYYIKQVSSINKLNSLVRRLEEIYEENLSIDILQVEVSIILRNLKDYYKFITKDILNRILTLGIEVESILIQEINSLGVSINIYDKERTDYLLFKKEFVSYVKTKEERPFRDSELDIKYRDYMSRLSNNRVLAFIEELKKYNISLTFEEEVMLGKVNSVDKEKYIEKIEEKIKAKQEIDELERRVYSKIKKSSSLISSVRIISSNESLEDRVVERLKASIMRSPEVPIIYNNVIRISAKNRKVLEEFRLNILCRMFFKEVLSRLKETGKLLEECLDADELLRFEKYSEFNFLDTENLLLLDKIKNLNIDNKFLSRNLVKQQLIAEYIAFIKLRGRCPSLVTTDEEELKLALNYDSMKSTLSSKELLKIEKAMTEFTCENDRVHFYENYYNFIINNGRFPCGNSDDPNEVRLNNLYLMLHPSLTKEQAREIKRLKKIYSKATLQANLIFQKRIKN